VIYKPGIGPVTIKVPKIRSRDGEPVTFRSPLVPPYVRKTKSLEAALPWLYLKGVSTGDMSEALEVLVGHEAKGLSASTVSRLKQQWAEEYQDWNRRSLDKPMKINTLEQCSVYSKIKVSYWRFMIFLQHTGKAYALPIR
jgi:transposase-like protein